MAVCSLDLLAEVDNLSISDGCSRTIKDNKKDNECSLFDALWSEDDASEVETSLNLTKICSLNFDETEDFQLPAMLSSNNITVRRKTKKKRHVSEDNGSEKYSSQTTESALQDLGSPFLDNLSCSSQSSDVSIALHQENAMLDSSPSSGDESTNVCRKLNNDFEQAENPSPDLNVTSSFLQNNDLKARLEQRLKNTKPDSTGKEIKLLDWECDGETNSFKQVSFETTPHSDHVKSTKTESLGKHPTNEAITSSCKGNELDISMNSFSSLTNNQLQSKSYEVTDESVQCGEVKNYSNQNSVFELRHCDSMHSYKEPIQSNTRSDVLSVSPKIENSIDQNVFQPKKEFVTPSTHVKQSSSNTRPDESLICLDDNKGYIVVDDNKGYIVGSYDDESKISNKCDSRQMNLQVEQSESNNLDDGTADFCTAVCSEIRNNFVKGSDKNVLESNAHHTDSVSNLLISPQLKKTTDTTKKSPLTCRLSNGGNDADGNDELLSNKENVCTPATKKKVIFLSSDSDSVWEVSDDSDCGKYNISLSSRLGKNLAVRKTTKEINTNAGNSSRKPNNERKPSTLSSRNVQFSDSGDDDDDFEQFLDKIKTPKPKSIPRYSFIVEDNWVDSSEDDDDDNGVTFSLTTPKSVTINSKDVPTFTPSTAPAKKTTLANLTERTLPVKKFNTPRLKTTPLKISTKDNSTRTIPNELFKYYNETVFDNKLPADLPIIWNKRMTKTAGFCYYIGSTNKKCRIELSDKVVDSCDRIRDTLIHELCHAATWLIDGVRAGHGPLWKRWAHKARMVHSDLPPISRCHSYDINYKFTYRCVRCQHSFGRHSKSINLKTARCPYCLSHLELLPKLNKDGTPAKTRAPTKFSLFVKDNYGKIKAKEPRSSHQEIMKELSKQFAQHVALDRENSTKT